jgi:hypothetical protein
MGDPATEFPLVIHARQETPNIYEGTETLLVTLLSATSSDPNITYTIVQSTAIFEIEEVGPPPQPAFVLPGCTSCETLDAQGAVNSAPNGYVDPADFPGPINYIRNPNAPLPDGP